MRFPWLVLVCSTSALAQSFEASVSGGQTVIPAKSATIGTAGPGPTSDPYKMTDGWRLGARMTLNQWRFMGHEFGYMYSRTGVDLPAAVIVPGGGTTPVQPGVVVPVAVSSHLSVPTHQGFYNFLVYAAPEGFIVRPFVTGGVQFTAFSQPNDYGNRETKYGVNYGAGVKVKVKEPWGFRLDVRQYNMGKPFKLPNNSGRLLMWEVSGGISFML